VSRRRDEDLDREIRDHLALEAEEREAQGLSPDEARRAARRAFGNVTTTREDARRVWVAAWLDHAVQDVRYAGRLARRHPAFTLGAVLILALGIGASTIIFGAINAIVLAPLPFDQPDRLVRITQTNAARGVDDFSVSLPLYRDWSTRTRSFAAIAALKSGSVTVLDAGDPQQLPALFMSHTLLPTLGLTVAHGRGLEPEDDAVGAGHVALLSDRFWRRALAGDPGAIGRTITIDGRVHTIIGVAPAALQLTGDADVLLPLVPFQEDRRGLSDLNVYARLNPTVTIAQATGELTMLARRIEQEYPEDHKGWSVRLSPLAGAIVGSTVPRILYVLLAAVGALLLVACANLSSLLLVRASARRREMAIRAAVGGGRLRLVRQLLTESLVLALAGGALGVGLSYGGMFVVRTMAADVPRAGTIGVDPGVLLFACLVTAAAGLLAGLAPARQASRIDVQRSLKESATSVARGANGPRNALVIGQIALSIVLLAAAGLTIRTLIRLTTLDLGFQPDRVLTVQVAPRLDPERFHATLLQRLRALPAVSMAGATSGVPMLAGFNTSLNVYPVGDARIGPGESIQCDFRNVTEGFFGAMGTPLLAGRDFTTRDTGRAPKVIVVNQTLSRQLWGGDSPIGKQVDLGGGGGEPATVIGLVGDVRTHNPAEPPRPTYYVSAYRGVWGPMTLAIRTNGDAELMLPLVRSEVRALDPTLPVLAIGTMDELVAAQLAPRRLVALLLAAFAAAALLLAVVGIYGVMAYSTGQRSREVAIRLALGATRQTVIAPLVREGAVLVIAGASIGVIVALPATRLLQGLLVDVSPADPLTLAAAIVLLTGTGLIACYLPARRASRVSPIEALRAE
jgi:putative ABC transport system permease protein